MANILLHDSLAQLTELVVISYNTECSMFICCLTDELMKCTQTYHFGDRTQGQQFPLNSLYGVAISINSTSRKNFHYIFLSQKKNQQAGTLYFRYPTYLHPVSTTKYTFCAIPKYNAGPNSNEEASSYSEKLSSTLVGPCMYNRPSP